MDEVLVLMHLEVHFSGSYSAMLDYYRQEGPGAIDEIDSEDIEHLRLLEEQGVPLTLSGEARQRVLEAKEAYKKIQALYDNPETAPLADLILAEEEKAGGVSEKHLPFLLELLHNHDFSNPLFPGYGLAPVRAAKILGEIQNEKVTQALFERLMHIGDEESYLQEEILSALRHAKEFLLSRLKARPLTSENQAAAMALGAVPHSPEIVEAAKGEHERLLQEGCQDKQLLLYLEALYN